MDPIEIINKYYNKDSKSYRLLIDHGELVAEKALVIAKKAENFNPDIEFIKKAALVHDIGMFLVDSPQIGCFGSFPYICHGYLGREILEKEGFLDYALVCERHIGAGLSVQEIKEKKLPLPLRDMIPVTVEEEIVCLADKFFSKNRRGEENIDEISKELSSYGAGPKKRFQELVQKFNLC